MTKGAAKKLIQQQLRRGHFAPREDRSEINCPLCKERVGIDHNPWEKREPHLAGALMDHLTFDCANAV